MEATGRLVNVVMDIHGFPLLNKLDKESHIFMAKCTTYVTSSHMICKGISSYMAKALKEGNPWTYTSFLKPLGISCDGKHTNIL